MNRAPAYPYLPFYVNHQPSADTDALVAKAAVAGKHWVLQKVYTSYSATPTGGMLTIDVEGGIKFRIRIPDSQVYSFDFTDLDAGGIVGGENQTVSCTLAGGGGAVLGSISAVFK